MWLFILVNVTRICHLIKRYRTAILLPLKVRSVINKLKNLSPGTIEPERGGPEDEAGDDYRWYSR
jgi:hypothetical protein